MMRIRVAIAVAFFGVATPAQLVAQTSDTRTESLPQINFPNSDLNGVSLSTASYDVPGPSISIGGDLGLVLSPKIAGTGRPYSLLHYCYSNCFVSGFFQISTNLNFSLSITDFPYENYAAPHVIVSTERGAFRFTGNGSDYPSALVEATPKVGRTLTYSSGNVSVHAMDSGERMTLEDTDGSKYIYFLHSNWCLYGNCNAQTANDGGRYYDRNVENGSHSFPIHKIIRPNGFIIEFHYIATPSYYDQDYGNPSYRLMSITTNTGYMLKFQYGSFIMGGHLVDGNPVVAVNSAVESCVPTAETCSFTKEWPTLFGFRTPSETIITPAWGTQYEMPSPQTMVDATGASTTVSWHEEQPFNAGSDQILVYDIARPGGATERVRVDFNLGPAAPITMICPTHRVAGSNDVYINYITTPCPYRRVKSIEKLGKLWSYDVDFNYVIDYYLNGNAKVHISELEIERVDPAGKIFRSLASASGQITSQTDELGRTVSLQVEPLLSPNEGRIISVTYPEGNMQTLDYDPRGNITERRLVAKPGSGLSDLVITASYATNCGNIRICNQPDWIIDQRGNRTDFIYAPEHGGLLKKTLPPDAGGVRPETRYNYVPNYAWLKSGSSWIQSSTPVWTLASEEYCRTSAADSNGNCAAGSSDEVVTTYEYQQGSSTKGSNILLIGRAVTADGKTLRTCFGYDDSGRKIFEIEAKAGLTSCQ